MTAAGAKSHFKDAGNVGSTVLIKMVLVTLGASWIPTWEPSMVATGPTVLLPVP